jgi:hypothetical protein
MDLLHRRDDELVSSVGHPSVAEFDDLVEIVSGVHMHDRERQR